MSTKTKIAAVLILLVAIAGVVHHKRARTPSSLQPGPGGSASITEAAAADVLGTYYFKGMGLMDVRQEGEIVITELYNERAAFEATLVEDGQDHSPQEKQAKEKFAKYRHHGRLVGPHLIEFDDVDLTMESLLKRFGFTTEELPSEVLLQGIISIPAGGLGHYYERWALLPNGSLRVDCAIPTSSTMAQATGDLLKACEFMYALKNAAQSPDSEPKFLDAWAAAHPTELSSVCGWKITESSERDAWQALDSGDCAKAAQLFRSAAQAQPKSPFPYLGEAWACIGTKEFDLARKALQAGRDRLSDETRPWLTNAIYFLKDQIYSYETAEAGPDVDFIAAAKEKPNAKVDLDLPGLQELLKKPVSEWDAADLDLANQAVKAFGLWDLVDKAGTMRGRGPLMPVSQGAFDMVKWAAVEVPNFVVLQNAAKTTVLRGQILQANHEYSESFKQYAQAVRFGQLLHHGSLISHLIGTSMEDIGLTAMVRFFSEGQPSEGETLQTLSKAVDSLDRDRPRLEPGELATYESNIVNFTSDPMILAVLETIAMPDFPEAETRVRTVEAKYSLVKAACAVKAKSLVEPSYPETMDPAELPEDPFAPGHPLRYRASGDEAVLYSVGPDKSDNGGALTYDPTNGTMSAGDVIVTIR